MSRYISSVLFICVGAFVLWYNGNHTDSVLLFPGIELVFPESKGDPHGQGRISGALFIVAGLVLLGVALLRGRRRPVEEE